ncbi:sensor histidine kinase [Gemmatimonas sp.]
MALLLGGLFVLAQPALRPSLEAQSVGGLQRVALLTDDYSVLPWTVAQGLPQSTVTRIVVDDRGYVWGSTFGGIFRFDGRSVMPLSATELPFLSTNAATALYENGADLWIGSPSGTVARLRGGRLVDSLPTLIRDQSVASIDALLVDRPGEVWIREGTDVHRWRDGRWSSAFPYPAYTPLRRDRSGAVLYLGPSGLVQIDQAGKAAVLAQPETGRFEGSTGLHIDRHDRVWMGCPTGLWVFEQGRLRFVYPTSESVNAITSDSTGAVWFAAGTRLYRLRPVEPHAVIAEVADGASVNVEPVLDAGAKIVEIAQLPDGLLALGTLEGMLVLRQKSARLLAGRDILPEVESGSLASAGDGTIFVTSGCGAVQHLDRNGRLIGRIARPTPASCSRSLLLDKRRQLWVGGDGAIRRQAVSASGERTTARRDTVFTIGAFLSTPPEVVSLLEHGDTVLFGLSDGRVGRVLPSDAIDYLPGWTVPTEAPVYSLAASADGAVWMGQLGMLSRWYRGEVTTFHKLHGVPNAVPRALLPDDRGGMWIGTYGSGLWHFRVGARARAVPLTDRTVSAIIADDDGRLWMSGNLGLSVVPLASMHRWLTDSTETPGVRLLTFAEGVPEGNSGRPAAVRMGPSLFAFANVSGLVQVNTAHVLTSGTTPAVQIDSVRTGDGGRLDESGALILGAGERVVLVWFSLPTYRFADAARFRYRLDGRDADWIALNDRREIRLAGLRPGRFTLHIEARVPGGEWRAAPSLRIEVEPLFSEQWWPRVVAAGIVLVLLLLVFRTRVRAAEATARAREVELQARREAAESAEQHHRELAQVGRVAVAGELTASLSHELGQPLAAIVNNAEVARRLVARQGADGAHAAAIDEALLDVVAQGRRASQVVREFRRFLKREHGERELLDVRELVDSTTLLLRQEFAESGVTWHVHVAPDTPAVLVERVLLQQVLVNLLQNAHEAARLAANGQVLVRARPVANGVRLSVADSGSGFPASMRRSAFEPFVTTRSSGMGMGLAIARRVVEAHGGHIAAGQLPRAGAVVSLWLPAQYRPEIRTDSLVPLQMTKVMNHG